MNTRRVPVDPALPEQTTIEEAARVLRAGGLVAFPTETVYGLGANALDARAARRIYQAKGRSPDDPCIVHIADPADLARLTPAVPASAEALAARFWPGPLSLIVRKTPAVPDVVTAGRPTVAVRLPSHPVALALIRAAGVPIAAPSANLFMHTSPTTAQHVWDDLAGRIELILDGGPAPIGIESTVLDLSGAVPVVLRPGGLSVEALRSVLPDLVAPQRQAQPEPIEAAQAASPGLFPKHYAPNAELILYEGERMRVLGAMGQEARARLAAGQRVGLLLAAEDAPLVDAAGAAVATLGNEDDLDGIARRLFAALRELERAGVDVILSRGFETGGIGLALRDRLSRAAGGRVVRV